MEGAKVARGFFWRLLERFGAQGVTFVVSIVLARILDPSIYGTVVITSALISILNVFVDSGLGTALIQKKNSDELDFSSVFYFNLFFGVILYVAFFFLAPYISNFFNDSELTTIVRVMGISVVIGAIKNIQQAYVSKNFLFKKFFFSTLGGTVGAAIIGILMAIKGLGVWALVAQSLFNTTIDTVVLWITVKWRPQNGFSVNRIKKLFSFGWKLLVSQIVNTVYSDVCQLIIGKKYSTSDLAYYNRGDSIPRLMMVNINTSLDSVLLPAMSKEQDDIVSLRNMVRRSLKLSTYLLFPLMIGIAVCAESLVHVVLTDKWLSCVIYIRLFCIIYAFYPIHTTNLNAINALGRSDIFLKLELIKKGIGILVIVITAQISVVALTYGLVFVAALSHIINSLPNWRLLNYSYLQQMIDIGPNIILSLVMGGAVYLIGYFKLNSLQTLFIQGIVGVFTYCGLSHILRNETWDFCIHKIKKVLYLDRNM